MSTLETIETLTKKYRGKEFFDELEKDNIVHLGVGDRVILKRHISNIQASLNSIYFTRIRFEAKQHLLKNGYGSRIMVRNEEQEQKKIQRLIYDLRKKYT